MLNALILVVALAVPIFGFTVDGGTDTFVKNMADAWSGRCKSVTNVDTDLERNYRLLLELANCRRSAIDVSKARRDFSSIFPNSTSSSISDLQKTDLFTFLRKFCPKYEEFLKCDEFMLPIYNDCCNAEELSGQKVRAEIQQSFSDFLCKNESELVTIFADEKGLECGIEKKEELLACHQEYVHSASKAKDSNMAFGILLPKPHSLCNSVEILKRCVIPIFDQCKLSETVNTLIQSFFTDIQTKTSCVHHI